MSQIRSLPDSIRSRIPRPGGLILALTALALASAAGLARAAKEGVDNMDTALNAHAAQVLHYLREHHCQNVGIVKFRVHKGNKPVSFKVGPLNDNLAARLEMALAVSGANKADAPIGIIHDADHVAMSRKLPSYTNPAGKRGLFAQKYHLVWDSPAVTPDLFLTGIVTVPADLKKAIVTIEAFAPNSAKMDKVISFAVPMDRSLLVDLNESFQVSSRKLKRHSRSFDIEEDASDDAAEKDQGKESAASDDASDKDTTPTPTDGGDSAAVHAKNPGEKLLDFQILYDDVPQAITADPASPGEFSVPEPQENQVVKIGFRSVAQERIGLVLMVNGVSTLYEEKQNGDVARNAPWIIDPGIPYMIMGYQVDGQSRKPFRVLSKEDSEAVSWNENTGQIHFHILKSGPSDGTKQTGGGQDPSKDSHPGNPMNISLRSLKRSDLVKTGHTRSLSALKDAAKAHAHAGPRKSRGLISPDASAVEGKINYDEFKNPVWVQTIIVRYYKPKGS
jgi:hypothetical protein